MFGRKNQRQNWGKFDDTIRCERMFGDEAGDEEEANEDWMVVYYW